MATQRKLFRRQSMAFIVMILFGMAMWATSLDNEVTPPLTANIQQELFGKSNAVEQLNQLEVKGRAPKTGYARKQFGDGWGKIDGCGTREAILARDMTNEVMSDKQCQVLSGTLQDPYTGETIRFQRGSTTSQAVQIDHVVALSDAWQKGAQLISADQRENLANDPMNLLAVDGPANQQKSDGDAATWLPPNKAFRCQYVARQIAVKQKYHLWVTEAEKSAMSRVLGSCTG